ncbi:hypothetical protein [Streptomyces sparsogenes]|uniref:Uncharacterized protein n=1 Tax=Streptomyces sparsogenes DSM 40356 TaxID=1331668 RepID=A0A1R1S8L9_9ACTN|nr:hypothetical protein [Streptomyces sparsogenes]OMI34469.1 hypothetical protein SPAR_36836 [Streptomyces sparsogenes DSM 40356]
MNAEQFNARYPVGTPVMAYPGARPEKFPNEKRLQTRTRSVAWTLGHGEPVVMVDGYTGGIALSHVDVIDGPDASVYETRLLTEKTLYAVDNWLDKAGVFAKQYTRYVDDKLTTVGLRIGEKPGHLVAYFGDTIVRHTDGTYTVRRVIERGETS